MLEKLLFKNQNKKQLYIAITGAFLGMTFLLTSIHYLVKINEYGKGNDILGPNTIVVQKRVSNSTSLRLTKTDFTEKEIDKLRKLPFITEVQPVITNSFDVYFQTNDELVPYFSSDIFIQSINPKFLDVKTENWVWSPEQKTLPIIMPRDFLVMLNTFMSANGIPQVSDDIAKQIKFKITLKSKGKKEAVDAKIIGFTNTVSSILVPESYMQYGNANFSNGKEQFITQIIISGKENQFGKIEEILKKKGLAAKNDQMIVGRLKSIVSTLFSVVLGISMIAVFLSGLVLIQFLQLLISKNSYEVRTLMRIGYHPRKIIRLFRTYFIKIFGIIALLSAITFFIFKFFIDSIFSSGGLNLNTEISILSLFSLCLAYFLFIIISQKTAKKEILAEF